MATDLHQVFAGERVGLVVTNHNDLVDCGPAGGITHFAEQRGARLIRPATQAASRNVMCAHAAQAHDTDCRATTRGGNSDNRVVGNHGAAWPLTSGLWPVACSCSYPLVFFAALARSFEMSHCCGNAARFCTA